MFFKGQTISLSLNTSQSLAGMQGYILVKKPNGVTESWAASIDGTNVVYDISDTDIDVAGVWEVQAYATDGSEHKYGQLNVIEFRTPLFNIV